MSDQKAPEILNDIQSEHDVNMLGSNYGIRRAHEVIEYVNRTGCKKDLFINTIGNYGERMISLFTKDLLDSSKTYSIVYHTSIRGLILAAIQQHFIHLSYLIAKNKLSDTQLEFMVTAINLKYAENEIKRMLTDNEVYIKLLIQYKRKFINNLEKITNLKTSLYLTDEIYNNIEEYCNFYYNRTKYDLFLQIKQYATSYEKLATFVETLDNYRKDTEDSNDIVITSTALDSALEVVYSMQSGEN